MFGLGKKSFLGIDIGTSSIKIVELEMAENKPVLSNYGWVHLDELVREKDSLALWKKYISKILHDGKFKSKSAYFSIPSAGSLITLIEFPEMSEEDLNQAIKFEAHKYVPVPLEEVVLSWDIIGKTESFEMKNDQKEEKKLGVPEKAVSSGKIQGLLVAAPKEKVKKYETLISELGLKLKSIEIEGFAMIRSLVGDDPGRFLIVDIGARVCNIILIEKGTIKVNRNIYAGGLDITKNIGKNLNIEEKRAENLKINGENFLVGESKITFPPIEIIINEIKRILEAFYKNGEKDKIDAVIISGGTAKLKGITDYFQNALGIKTVIGNPLSRVGYPVILEPKLEEFRSRFSVAIGLALKGIEDSLKK